MKKVKIVEMTDVLLTEKEYKRFLVNLEDDVQKYANEIADKKTQSFVSITLADGTKIEKVGKEE